MNMNMNHFRKCFIPIVLFIKIAPRYFGPEKKAILHSNKTDVLLTRDKMSEFYSFYLYLIVWTF